MMISNNVQFTMKNENITEIINASGANYLGEIEGFTDLPSKCRFNKVLTGSGGTSVALSNDKPYVLCMPYVSLIQNKIEWCNERGIAALPVYSGAATSNDIEEFEGKKILVTYDSLRKVVDSLGKRVKDYKILIDEYHLLINSGSFRYDAVNEVLRLYKEFGDYVFMTATPTKPEYLPEILQSIPEVTVAWDNIAPVTLDFSIIEQKHLYATIANIAEKFISGENKGNAYFFLNSIKGIIDIVSHLKKLKVTYNDVRIICSNSKENQARLDEKIGKKFAIGKPSDFPKKLNFLTSTVFEGSDFLDKEGVTYIVSDGVKSHTKYDIMTTVPQIIGRIRDTQYKSGKSQKASKHTYLRHWKENPIDKSQR